MNTQTNPAPTVNPSSCYVSYLEFLAEKLAGNQEPPLVSATDDQLEIVEKFLSLELSASLPVPYAEFLRLANGYSYNGVTFFTIATDGALPELIRENSLLRIQHPVLADYLVLGKSGLWYYTFHVSTDSYRALQVGALSEPYYVFEDLDDCLSSALEETLELLDEPNE